MIKWMLANFCSDMNGIVFCQENENSLSHVLISQLEWDITREEPVLKTERSSVGFPSIAALSNGITQAFKEM